MNRIVHAAHVAATTHSVGRNDTLTAAVGFCVAANLMPTRQT